jgi:D-beta-D-heptose 7-phosphate kinase/D-beta-D-heptose 1-phosphate adenosyltransferase
MRKDTIDLTRLDHCRLLVVGDLMLDEYVRGTVDRISPEAPVQVVSVDEEDATLGGAGNVVNNLSALGIQVAVVGVLGRDSHGRRLIRRLREVGADVGGVLQSRSRLTIRKTRILADHQQVLRVDRETTGEIDGRLRNRLLEKARASLADVDAVVISDYGKGLVSASLVRDITASARQQKKMVVVDPKGRDYTKYNGATLITPNTKEASLASGVDIRNQDDLCRAADRLLSQIDIDGLLITRGKQGVAYFDRHHPPLFAGTRARQVFDVSGAGDTVVAVLSAGLAAGYEMPEAIWLANAAAGIVVSKIGTATVSRIELQRALAPGDDPSVSKHKTLTELKATCASLKSEGKRIVLTNGCFDLLHAGHIRLFGASREFGDVLVVALDDDKSVRDLKGSGRPVITAAERIKILSAIDSIDYVTVFTTGDLLAVIRAVKPDVLAKGSDYRSTQVLGRDLVEKMGGRVELVPLTEGVSSSRIIDSIKKK